MFCILFTKIPRGIFEKSEVKMLARVTKNNVRNIVAESSRFSLQLIGRELDGP